MDNGFDILDQLDAEISAVVAKSSLTDRKSVLSKKANNTLLPHEKRLALKRELEEVNAQLSAIQWSVVSNVAMFAEQTCSTCGTVSVMFLQHMERLRTNFGAKVDRLARVERPHPGFPNEAIIQRSSADLCGACCSASGYILTEAKIVDRTSRIMKES